MAKRCVSLGELLCADQQHLKLTVYDSSAAVKPDNPRSRPWERNAHIHALR
jgi:hypothetical protein